MQTPTVTCPKCGYGVEPGTPVCGNCGQLLGSNAGHATLAAPRTGAAKLVAVVLLVGLLGGGAWAAQTWVGERVGDITSLTDAGADPVEYSPVVSPYRGIRDLVSELNAGGLRCKQAKVDSADEWVATGSCQVPRGIVTTHVQINIYFRPEALASAEDIFDDRTFHYVHGDNWFVITQLGTARRVHDILGGELVRAKDA